MGRRRAGRYRAGGGGGGGSTAWDDDFNVGASVDTAGTRFAGANPWTAFNHGASGCSFTQSGSILAADSGAADPGTNPRGYTQPFPVGDCRFRIKFSPVGIITNFQAGGLLLRESSTGKMLLPCVGIDGSLKAQVRRMTSTTTWVANYNGGAASVVTQWIEVDRTGSTLTFSVTETAADGNDLTTALAASWASASQTTDFTTAPDQIGFFVNSSLVSSWAMDVDWFLRLA